VANATEHHDDHDHGISHVGSVKMLVGTWVTLTILTILTVLATRINLGASGNLGLAMAIAVIKASLACVFFMHLRYDKIFHSVLLVGGILAASLFVGFTLMDSGQYQSANIWDVDHPPAAPLGPRPVSE
jgi:cytochrome c oxidase subunit 4